MDEKKVNKNENDCLIIYYLSSLFRASTCYIQNDYPTRRRKAAQLKSEQFFNGHRKFWVNTKDLIMTL